MNQRSNQREEFAKFLEVLAAGRSDTEQWSRHVVAHYHDDLLESVRRQVVRLAIVPGNQLSFPLEHAEQLMQWADGLRRGDTSLKDSEYL
jgi:hypothetical protein